MRAPVSRTDRNFSFKYARMCSPYVYTISRVSFCPDLKRLYSFLADLKRLYLRRKTILSGKQKKRDDATLILAQFTVLQCYSKWHKLQGIHSEIAGNALNASIFDYCYSYVKLWPILWFPFLLGENNLTVRVKIRDLFYFIVTIWHHSESICTVPILTSFRSVTCSIYIHKI